MLRWLYVVECVVITIAVLTGIAYGVGGPDAALITGVLSAGITLFIVLLTQLGTVNRHFARPLVARFSRRLRNPRNGPVVVIAQD